MEDNQPMILDDLASSPSPAMADISIEMTDDCDDGDGSDYDKAGVVVRTPMMMPPSTSSFPLSSSPSLRVHDDGGITTGPSNEARQELMVIPTPPPGPPFVVDDKVLCLHGSSKALSTSSSSYDQKLLLYYPAVVRKIRFEAAASAQATAPAQEEDEGGGQWEFFVHFVGWHHRYDRWATCQDLVPDTPEQRARNEAKLPPPPPNRDAASPQPSAASRTKRKKRAASTTGHCAFLKNGADVAMAQEGGESSARPKSHKRAAPSRGASSSSSSSSSAPPLEEYCELPLTLKTVLWDEWERLNPRDYLYHCPAHPINTNNSSAATTGEPTPSAAPRTRLPTRVVHDLPAKATVKYVVSHFGRAATQKWNEANQPPPPKGGTGATTTATTTTFADAKPAASTAAGSKPSGATPERIQEFCHGLLQLFETALPLCLLYPQERPQYEALLADHRLNSGSSNEEASSASASSSSSLSPPLQLAAVYGCEHLLRLLVRLPVLMRADPQASSSSSPSPSPSPRKEQLRWMGPLLRELIVLLQKNRSQVFSKSNYRPPHAPHEYLEWERDLYGMNAKPP